MSPRGQESEAATRRKRVDPLLKAQGWEIVPYVPGRPLSSYTHHAITEYPTSNGPADYAFVVAGQLLGIVEAKRVTLGPQNVLDQAERYSRAWPTARWTFAATACRFSIQPMARSYGFTISVTRLIARAALLASTPLRPSWKCSRVTSNRLAVGLTSTPTITGLRPYQVEANTAIEQAINARKRQMLVAMATGTGKTFTMVNETYRLMESKVGKRILFLVDRRALAAQAVRAFRFLRARAEQEVRQNPRSLQPAVPPARISATTSGSTRRFCPPPT